MRLGEGTTHSGAFTSQFLFVLEAEQQFAMSCEPLRGCKKKNSREKCPTPHSFVRWHSRIADEGLREFARAWRAA